MKLYSRGQVARRISYGVAVAFVLTAILFYNLGKNQAEKKVPRTDETSVETLEVSQTDDFDTQIEFLEQSDFTEVIVPVANNQTTYTQD